MDLRIYRQRKTTLRDGLIVYSGEDGRPYVDDRLIMVADGLGGTGALRHTAIHTDVLDRETVVDAFFKGIYDDLDNNVFANYVIDSFVELYELKDYFGKNTYAYKKSSYYGSRLVLSIMLHHLKNDTDLRAEKLFDELIPLNEKDREEYLTNVGKKIESILKEDLHQTAVNANIIRESTPIGARALKLLPTTMCVTVFQEKENCVDALYFIAGDSRPYFWSEKGGLCQVTEDLEGEDGGMTSCVYEGDGKPGNFTISCKYFRFSKPCILFNASDGCFDSALFKSQMGFEKLILDAIAFNNSVQDIENALVAQYDIYGTHDDSSTLALKSFGYETEDALKAACKRRLSVLDEKYFSKLEELLTKDYVSEYQQLEKKLTTVLASAKERFISDPAVRDWCTAYIQEGKYPPYKDAIHSIEEEIKTEESRIQKARDRIVDLVARNYSRFIEFTDKKTSWSERRSVAGAKSCLDNCERFSDDYIFELEKFREDFERTIEAIKSMLENIYEIGVPESFEDYSDLNFEMTKECEKTLGGLFRFFDNLKKKKVKIVKRLLAERDEYIKRNLALANKNQEQLKAVCEMVFDNRIDVNAVEILAFDKKAIYEELRNIETSKRAVEEYGTKYKVRALDEAVTDFMDKEYGSIVVMVLKDDGVPIDSILRTDLAETVIDDNEQLQKTQEKADLQAELFEEYKKGYERIMRGEFGA